MSEDIINKTELAKKLIRKSSLEDAFDSDSSNWSDQDNEPVNPPKVTDKSQKQATKPNPDTNKTDNQPVNPNANTDGSANTSQSNANIEHLFSQPSSSGQQSDPSQISLASVIEKKIDGGRLVEEKQIAETVTIQAEIVPKPANVKEESDDDNWDDEEEYVSQTQIVEKPDQSAKQSLFQSSTNFHKNAPKETDSDKHVSKEMNIVEWSPSGSSVMDGVAPETDDDEDGVSIMSVNEDNDKHPDPPAPENKMEPGKVDIVKDLHNSNKTPSVSVTSSVEQEPVKDIKSITSLFTGKPPEQLVTPAIFTAAGKTYSAEVDKRKSSEKLSRNKSETNLATDKSSLKPISNIKASSSSDVEALSLKKSLTNKGFFSKLLSSDNSSKHSTLKRKSSEPIPLPKLLLENPDKSAGDIRSRTLSTGESSREIKSTLPSSRSETFKIEEKVADINFKQPLTTSTKPKTFIGKMKKSLGVGKHAKSRKESLATIPIPITKNFDITEHGDGDNISTEGQFDEGALIKSLYETKRLLLQLDAQAKANASGDSSDELEVIKSASHFERTPTKLSVSSVGSSSRLSSDHSLNENKMNDPGRKFVNNNGTSQVYRYCQDAIKNSNNRDLLQNVLADVQCIFDKTIGTQDQLQSNYNDLGSEVLQLREALDASESCRIELERKLQECQLEYQNLKYCYDEEVQARENLEKIVCDLKGQVERLNEALNLECADKAALNTAIRQLEVELQNLNNQLCDSEAERSNLLQSCRSFEGSKNKCSDLQAALAQCCEKYDTLQREVLELKRDNNNLKLNLETCQYENNKLLADIDCMKQQFSDEKACLETKICELARSLEEMERAKNEACRKMNEFLKAHHDELDNISTDRNLYMAKYEAEKREKDELAAKLRDCEENKRRRSQEQEQQLAKLQEGAPYLQQQVTSLQQDVTRYKSLHQEEKTLREKTERKLSDVEDSKKKALQDQQVTYQHQIQQNDLDSEKKIHQLEADVEKFKLMNDHEKRRNEEMEQRLKNVEGEKRQTSQENLLQQQQQDFYSKQKVEILETEVAKYKNMLEDEKKIREDTERRLREADEHNQKSLQDQKHTLQLQQQQQDFLSHQKWDLVKIESDRYKSMLDEERRAREEAESKVKNLEEQKYKSIQEHQLQVQQHQQQLESYSQRKLDLIKRDTDKLQLMLDEEKRVRDDLERRLRDTEEQKMKIIEEHRIAIQKQQDHFSQLHATALQQTEEEKVTRELWQRELRDAQKRWETEVKAKGILAEKLAKFEKQQNAVDAHNQRDYEEVEKYKGKLINMKHALKSEKELNLKLANKLDETKSIVKSYKIRMDELINDPKIQNLLAIIDNLKSQCELHTENSRQDKDKLMGEICKLNQEKWRAEREAKKLSEDMKIIDAEKTTWQNLAKMKDRIELEFVELKRAVKDQFVDKRDLEQLRLAYERKLSEIKQHYENEAQQQICQTLSKYTNQFGKEAKDRMILDRFRDTNENTLRTELTTVTKSMQSDIVGLKGMIRDRDEEIITLRKSLDVVKEKYANESRDRESILRRLTILSSSSQDMIPQPGPSGSIM